jgi:hypothetical protein
MIGIYYDATGAASTQILLGGSEGIMFHEVHSLTAGSTTFVEP